MIQLDQRMIGFITMFEKISKARVKDCFEEDDTLIFVIKEGDVFKAVGKGGATLRKVSDKLRKKIKVIEFSSDIKKFIHNLLYPGKPEIEIAETKIVIKAKDAREKGQIYGRDRSNLKKVQGIVSKYFKVEIVVE
jgi:transcription termination/antitermination protein NusA